MTDTKHSADLPPLPKGFFAGLMSGYSAEQMQAYARAAIAAAAPASQPVAWRVTHYDSSMSYCRNKVSPCGGPEPDREVIPLYAAPVPTAAPKAALTHDQILEICMDKAPWFYHNATDQDMIDLAQAIEAASGPNAALVTLLKEILDDGHAFIGVIELSSMDGVAWAKRARAALAAAGVKP